MGEGKVKILALIGSPRKGGNTDIMADEVLAGARAAGAAGGKLYLDDYQIRPIAEVADNSRARGDPRSDDDFPALLDRFLDADIVVWSTPVYWLWPSAQMKCFLDRTSSYFNHPDFRERFEGKGHILLCAHGRKDADHGRWITEPMRVVVEVLHGTYLGDVRASVYEKGRVRDLPEVVTACRELGLRAVHRRLEDSVGHGSGGGDAVSVPSCSGVERVTRER